MVFGPANAKQQREKLALGHSWHLDGHRLRVELESVVYLGVTLTPDLGWRGMRKAVQAKLNQRVGRVRSMHLSYGADHPRLIRMVTYALVGSAVEFACAVWADGRRTGGNASFMDACQKAWHAPLGTALRVSQRASGVVLRGDMGVWSVLARWDAMRLIMYFPLRPLARY